MKTEAEIRKRIEEKTKQAHALDGITATTVSQLIECNAEITVLRWVLE